MELIGAILNTYKNNKPNIKEMERLAITIGCSAEYKHDVFQRWFRWLFLHDCKYVLTRNEDDMRNYTA